MTLCDFMRLCVTLSHFFPLFPTFTTLVTIAPLILAAPSFGFHRYEPSLPFSSRKRRPNQLAGAYSSDTVRSSSLRKGVYAPQGVFLHAVLLHQAFAHCGKFLTAASRRSLGRVSVPVWLIILSDQLLIVALGGRYPHQLANQPQAPLLARSSLSRYPLFTPQLLWGISISFPMLSPSKR